MVRETQKAKIERLENTIKELQEIINKQNSQIDSMIDKADNSFENSVTYRQMKKQIEDLELKLKVAGESIEHNRNMYNAESKKNDELIKEIETLKKSNEKDLKEAYRDVAALELQIESKDREHNRRIKELEKYYTYKSNNQKKHNERGAGRKARFSESQITEIKMYRFQGKTIKEIAELFNCSVGLIHKLINE